MGDSRLVSRLLSLVKKHPCFDCNLPFPYYQLEFDHRVANHKLFNIGGGVRATKDFEQVLAEISKCDLLCNGCAVKRNELFGSRKDKKGPNGFLFTPDMRRVGEARMQAILLPIIRLFALRG